MATPQLSTTRNPFLHVKARWTPTEVTESTLFHERGRGPIRHQAFHPFSRLPLELRTMIWRYAMPSQRVIEIRSWSPQHAPIKYSVAPHRPPVVLQVNRESRREGLRSYRLIDIGVSTWQNYNSSEVHIPWKYHPVNRNADPKYVVRDNLGIPRIVLLMLPWDVPRLRSEPAMPYSPQKVYIDFSRDTIYLGPEFNPALLYNFLTTTGRYQELRDLQYLALDRHLWLGTSDARADYLRTALYSLRHRLIKEIYIVPDDAERCLEDKYYYRRHKLSLRQPLLEYAFWAQGAAQTEPSKTVVDNLGEWFERFWGGSGREVPRIAWRSVRRDGRRLGDYKTGAWEVQRKLGDMAVWKTWQPSEHD